MAKSRALWTSMAASRALWAPAAAVWLLAASGLPAQPAAQPTGQRAGQPATALAPSGAAPPAAHAAAPPAAQTATPPAAPPLQVEVVWPQAGQDTGTYHALAQLRLSHGHAKPFVMHGDPDYGEPVPIPGPQLALGREHVLLLGWSSTGGGTTNLHALLLRVGGKTITLAQTLQATVARTHATLVVRSGPQGVLLGVPEAVRGGSSDAASDVSLLVGPGSGTPLSGAQLAALPWVATATGPTDSLYSPPFHNSLVPIPQAKDSVAAVPPRVAWLSVTPNGFSWLKTAH